MAEKIYTEETTWHNDYAVPLAPSKYARLEGYALPDKQTLLSAQFGTDSFLPDFDIPARLNRIPLIKGAAVQHNLPAPTAAIIDIVGWCRREQDKTTILRLFYSNLPELSAPYPTEWLQIRRDYYMLYMPDGRQQRVRFSDTPRFTAEKGQTGRVLWTVTLRFYAVIDEEDLEYLG